MAQKTILITGASHGLGAAIAKSLAPGNRVYVHYNHSASGAEAVAESIRAAGGQGQLIQADLACSDAAQKIVDQVKVNSDKLDLLINNAAVLPKNTNNPEQFDWHTLQQTFSINVFSLMQLSILCKPLLLNAEKPSVINMGSIAAQAGGYSLFAESYLELMIYAASKGAVDTFTRGLAKAFAPQIRVNSIAPGVVDTGIHQAYFDGQNVQQETQALIESAQNNTPLKCNGRLDDVISVVNMLIENQYITGQCIDVNGGLLMR